MELLQALQYSVGKTQQEVEFADQYLQQVKYQDGFVQHLLLIACDANINLPVRQAALVRLKYTIRERWSHREHRLSDQDKKVIKDSILDGLVNCAETKKLYTQLEDVVRFIAQKEFPDQWPTLFDNIVANFHDQADYKHLFGSLIALKCLVKNYKFLDGKDRMALEKIVKSTFPFFGELDEDILSKPERANTECNSPHSQNVFASINMGIPEYLMDGKVIETWMLYFENVINMPVNQGQKDSDARRFIFQPERNVAWLCKKWCAEILNKLLNRFCNKNTVKDENIAFPDIFLSNYAVHFQQSFLNFLYKLKDHYAPPKVRCFALKYIMNSISYLTIRESLAPHLEQALYEIFIPTLMLTPQDEEDWIHNPLEYVRKYEDVSGIIENPKMVIKALINKDYLKTLFRSSDGLTLLNKYLEFVRNILVNHIDPQKNVKADYRLIEAALYVLGMLKDAIVFSEELIAKIAILFENLLIPHFSNTKGPLKYRVCWLIGVYSDIRLQNRQNILVAADVLYGCLCQDEPPVRIQAGISLNQIFDDEDAQTHIKPHLDKILLSYVSLIDAVDNENLTRAFEDVILKFVQYIQPYAIDLVKYLTNAFMKADEESIQSVNVNEIHEKDGVASRFLSTIVKILQSSLSREIVHELQVLLIPTLDYILKIDCSNHFKLGLEILDRLLFNLEVLSDEIWNYFPLLCYLIVGYPGDNNQYIAQNELTGQYLQAAQFNGKGEEYVQEIVPCLQKYMQKDTNIILTRKDPHYNLVYLELLFQAVDKVYEICYDCENDTDMVLISTIYIALIENYQQLSNEILQFVIDKVIINMPLAKSIAMEKILLQIVIAVCLWYNPSITVQYLGYKDAIEMIFKVWMSRIQDFKYIFEFKRIMFGLSSLFRVDLTLIPTALNMYIKPILKQIVSLNAVITEMRENNLNSFVLILFLPYIIVIKEIKKKQIFNSDLANNDQGTEQNDENYEDPYENYLEDYEVGNLVEMAEEYHSPLLETCEILYWKHTLEVLKNSQSQFFGELVSALSQEELVNLENNFGRAVQRATQRN